MTAHTVVNGLRGGELRPPGETTPAPRRRRDEKPPSTSELPASNPTTAAKTLQPGRKVNRFPVSSEAREFYKRFYPGSSPDDWNDWRWQSRHRIRSLSELERIFQLSE